MNEQIQTGTVGPLGALHRVARYEPCPTTMGLDEFCARHLHRTRHEYAFDPWERARAYIDRMTRRHDCDRPLPKRMRPRSQAVRRPWGGRNRREQGGTS